MWDERYFLSLTEMKVAPLAQVPNDLVTQIFHKLIGDPVKTTLDFESRYAFDAASSSC
jgi:hypothetical protein